MGSIIEKITFRFKWLVMSEKSRYAYLWARTREQLETEYVFQDESPNRI